MDLATRVATQGDHVRKLKAAKVDKAQIDAAVAELLRLKKELAAVAPVTAPAAVPEAAPEAAPAAAPAAPAAPGAVDDAAEIAARVTAQGDQVRQLKAAKADKAQIDAAVAELLRLKKELAVLDPASAVLVPPPSGGKSKKKK